MKYLKYAMMMLMLFSVTNGFAENVDLNKLIDALIVVESNGKDDAIGDNGNAVGCLQLWKTYVDDVNRFSKTNYSYQDRLDRVKSIEMVKRYLSFYGKLYTKKTGKSVTYEVLARIHNGGPNGYKKEATKKYWKMVSSHLK